MVALYLAKPYLACRWSVALVWFWVIGWKLVQQWNNLETLVSRHETWSKIHLKQATWPDWSIRLLRRSNKGPLAKRSLNLWLLDRCVWILLHLPLIPVCICNLKKLQLASDFVHLFHCDQGPGPKACNNSESTWTQVYSTDSSRNLGNLWEKSNCAPSPAHPMEKLRVWWLNVQGRAQSGFDHFYA